MNSAQSEQLFVESGPNMFSAGIFLFGAIVVLLFMIIVIAAMWKLFTKAGEPGWKALIPIYNSWVFLRLGDQAGWWALVALIPLVNIVAVVFMAIAAYNIGLKLGKEGWYVVLYVLVPIIWMLILAFDKSTWNTKATGVVPSPVGSGDAPAFVPPAASSDTKEQKDEATKE